jgi:poly(A) polymerase
MKTTAKEIVRKIQDNGYQAVFCGGVVRDMLMNVEPHDIDIATNCPIEVVANIFDHVIMVGESFGVIRIIEKEMTFEVANFRMDGEYKNGRSPESVSFCSMGEDAKRRDFTINGLFYDPITDVVYDYVDGKKDIEDGRVRFIGCAEQRIKEDHLRLMRFVRFAARFGNYDPESMEAVKKNSNLISTVSAERIREEFEKGLILTNASTYIDMLIDSGIMQHIMPEYMAMKDVIQSPVYHPEGCVHNHVKQVLDQLNGESINLKLSGFFHDIGKLETTVVVGEKIKSPGHAEVGAVKTYEIMKRLKYSNNIIDYVCSLISDHMKIVDVSKWSTAKQKRFLAQENFSDLFILHKADKNNRKGLFNVDSIKVVNDLLTKFANEPIKPAPFINGRDIMDALKITGRDIGEVKEHFYDMQLEGKFTDREEAIKYLSDEFKKILHKKE